MTNDEISDKYRLYLDSIKFNDKNYYTLWHLGANDEDELLIDTNKRIVLFREQQAFFDYLKTVRIHNAQLQQWADELRQPILPYSNVNIDALNSDIDFTDSHDFANIITALDMLGDYAHQVEDEILINVLSNDIIVQLRDNFMDIYVWNTEIKEVGTSIQLELVLPLLKQVYTIFNNVIAVLD